MITRHGKDHLVLHDSVREHRVDHDAFRPVRAHANGGLHPAITEDHEGWFMIHPAWDTSGLPLKIVEKDVLNPLTGQMVPCRFVPITAYLQAHYGPDNEIVTIPINGDSNAQHLHWLHRSPKERKEMRALLEWLGAWRLGDDGEPLTEEEQVDRRLRSLGLHSDQIEVPVIEPEPEAPRRRRRRG